MTDTILLPTDGSAPATVAARHASLLAAGFDAEIHVLSVVPEGGAFHGVDDPGEAAEAAVESATTELGDVSVTTAVREGDPAETIVEYADAAHADLIVMGTHGRTGVRRMVSGSVTEHVTRAADVPVFTVRGDGETPAPADYEDVLVPTDGSGCAEAAVDVALDLATAFDAEIHAVSVVDVNTVAAQSELTNARLVLDELEDQAQAAVDRVADRTRSRGLGGETAVLQGSPASALMDYTEENGVDVVVMGTHGRSGLGRFLLGSTTERLIRHASVPVMSVRPPRDAE